MQLIKKVVVMVLIFLIPVGLIAETYYRMDQKSYDEISSDMDALKSGTGKDQPAAAMIYIALKYFFDQLDAYDTESASKDIKYIRDYFKPTIKESEDKNYDDIERVFADIDHILTQYQAHNYNEEISVLRGEISLIKMRFVQMNQKNKTGK